TGEAVALHDGAVGEADHEDGDGEHALEAQEGAASLDVAGNSVGPGRPTQAGDQQPPEHGQEEGAGEEGDEVEAVEGLGVGAGGQVEQGEARAADAGEPEGETLGGPEQRRPGLLDATTPAEQA